MINLGTAVGTLALDASSFNATLETAYENVAGLDTKFGTLSGGLGVIGKGLTTVGKTLTTTVTAPVVGFGAASVKAGADFDSAMSKVMAIGGDFGELQDKNSESLKRAAQDVGLQYEDMGSYAASAFNLVRQYAIQMGNDTKFTAEESADALYYMALAGWGGAEMLDGLKGIMDLSAASGVELARTSDIVTDALTAFGESADQSGRFANILAATSANSNTNVDLLGESFKYVGAVAGAYGYSLEDVSLALGTMASAGVKGTQAGTGLRQALKQLTNPTDENAALMDKFGIKLADAQGNMYSLRELMGQWRESFAGLNVDLYDTEGNLKTGEQILEEYGHSMPTSEFEKLNAIASIFGTRALPGVMAIINSSDEDFQELAYDIDNSSTSFGGMGDAAYQAATMLDNLKGDWILFTSALGTAKVIISDMVNGPLRSLLKWLRDMVTAFNTASPETQQFIIKMALIAASIGPVIFAIGKIVALFSKFYGNIRNIHAAITLLQKGFTAVGALIGGLSAPMIVIIAFIAAMVAAFIHLWNTNETFRNRMTLIWNNIVATVSYAINTIKSNFDKLMKAWGPGLKVIKEFAKTLLDAFAPFLEGTFAAIGATITEIFSLISDVFGLFVSLVTGDFAGAAEYAASIWDNFKSFVVTSFDTMIWGILQFIGNIAQAFGPGLEAIFGVAEQLIVAVGTFIFEKVSEIFTAIGNAVTGAFNWIVTGISNIYNGIINWFANIIASVVKWALDFVAKGQKASSDFFNKVYDFLSELPGAVYGFFSKIISDAVDWGANLVSEGYNAASSFYDDVTNYISSLVDSISGFFSDIISNTISWASDFVSKAGEAASDFYDDITSGLQQIPDAVYSIGSDIVQGLWNGISDMGGWLWGKVTGFASGIIDTMKSAVEVGSPSKLAEREVGRWLPPGIAVGFEKALPASMRKIEDSLNGAITDYNDNIKSFVIGSTFIDPSIVSNGMSGQIMSEMYWLLAQYIAEALRTAPIVNNVNVEMEDGDVIMDRERVGRSLAPVISRIIAAGGG